MKIAVVTASRRANDPNVSPAKLLARVFAIDIERCPCGGRRRITDVVLHPDEIA